MNSSTKSNNNIVLWVILILLIISSISFLLIGIAGTIFPSFLGSSDSRDRIEVLKEIRTNPVSKGFRKIGYTYGIILLVIAFLIYYFGIRKL